MKLIPLPSQEYLLECFSYCQETGDLYWKRRPPEHFDKKSIIDSWNSRFENKKAGCISSYYCVLINKKKYTYHRIIWKLLYNEDPTYLIDHINGNKLDNRISNLRKATVSENKYNSYKHIKNSSSKYKGVYFDKRYSSYRAKITVNKKIINLGSFKNECEAYKAYCEASIKYHGEFSNFGQTTLGILQVSTAHL
jgi:hypothetical protein